MNEVTQVDFVVIGAGVVGAAVASTLTRKFRDKTCVILESGPRIAEGVTSRNSGVIHAGIYYPPTSLKARSCVRGNALLYEWAGKHGVAHRKTGKLIVAKEKSQLAALESTLKNALASGARELKMLTAAEVSKIEPAIEVEAAILSSTTGIVDPFELTKSFIDDAQSRGAILLTDNKVSALKKRASGGYEINTTREKIEAQVVVNCAGLYADEIAMLAGLTQYKIYPWRGDYFTLKTSARFNHLIYPVKDAKAAGLGVHLTIDIGGRYKLGPDVEPAKSKEDFRAAPEKEPAFLAAAQKLFGGGIAANDAAGGRKSAGAFDLEYDMCGIRPKLRAPGDKDEKDFVVSEDLPGLINLVGIESPGLTSCLALAEEVLKLI
jgi:L-2-hydroxyglutarate oxidase LhgO